MLADGREDASYDRVHVFRLHGFVNDHGTPLVSDGQEDQPSESVSHRYHARV